MEYPDNSLATPLPMEQITVAPLLSPVQEVSISSSEITIEMHMHNGPEVCYFILKFFTPKSLDIDDHYR